MKAKVLVIGIFVCSLVGVVYLMLQYGSDEKIIPAPVVFTVASASAPVLENILTDELQIAASESHSQFRCGKTYVQKRTHDGNKTWKDIFIKGVNLGVALPGKFATQFSMTRDQYLAWFDLISKMHANTIRIYTILPPDFYDALSYFNMIHADRPLYLIQGIWARVPKNNRYTSPVSEREFKQEIVRAVDVIHGNAQVQSRPGSASGTYVNDISKYVIAFVLGHEWEPQFIAATDSGGVQGEYRGNFIEVHGGSPMEQWLGSMMDYAVTYQTWRYHYQLPISFINWQATDPLYHNSSYARENRGNDYDAVSLDFNHFHVRPGFRAGMFASFHAYPYFPDFVYREPLYAQAKNHRGDADNYVGYVQSLAKHSVDIPVLIAEYGLASSRGNNKYSPFGFNQGGHSEQEHAALVTLLTEDIHQAGCAGALYFEWSDEWFKGNWTIKDWEMPRERRVFWHNRESPEQNYGVMAVEVPGIVLDGYLDDWPLGSMSKRSDIMMHHDAAYVYVALRLYDFKPGQTLLNVAFDTYGKNLGNRIVPGMSVSLSRGAEFLLQVHGLDSAEILIDADYLPRHADATQKDAYVAPLIGGSGRWVSQRFPLGGVAQDIHGTYLDTVYYSRGVLRYGKERGDDWFFNERTSIMKIRIPWQLLQVSDPSGHAVVYRSSEPDSGFALTDEIALMAWQKGRSEDDVRALHGSSPYRYQWDAWEQPAYQFRLKPVYSSLQHLFPLLIPKVQEKKKATTARFSLCLYPEGRRGALSVILDSSDFSQYTYALPLLEEARIQGTFRMHALSTEQRSHVVQHRNGIHMRRFGMPQVTVLKQCGHEVSLLTDKNIRQLRSLMLVRMDTVTTYGLEKVLAQNLEHWIGLRYYQFSNDDMQVHATDVRHSTKRDMFRRHLRMARNSGMWIAPLGEVVAYRAARQGARLRVKKINENFWEIMVKTLPASKVPLSVQCRLPYNRIRVTGSNADGIYVVRDDHVVLTLIPGVPLTLEGVE